MTPNDDNGVGESQSPSSSASNNWNRIEPVSNLPPEKFMASDDSDGESNQHGLPETHSGHERADRQPGTTTVVGKEWASWDDFIEDPITNQSQQEDVPIFNDTAGSRVVQPLEGVPTTIPDVPAEGPVLTTNLDLPAEGPVTTTNPDLPAEGPVPTTNPDLPAEGPVPTTNSAPQK